MSATLQRATFVTSRQLEFTSAKELQVQTGQLVTQVTGTSKRLRFSKMTASLKMAERPDWSLFRTFDGLQQRAGVPAKWLRRLVLKEIGDNALDVSTNIRSGGLLDGHYFVEDKGPGLDGTPEQIAELYSMARPMRSSKLLRLPQRGALGNGLRVVAGTVFASEGKLAVTTRNKRIELRPLADGTTQVVKVEPADYPVGTRVDISFGAALPADVSPFRWMNVAQYLADEGEQYRGQSSAHWYDAAQFHELLLAHGALPVRALIAELDGCSGGKAGEIVAGVGLGRAACQDVTRAQAEELLKAARKRSQPVSTVRLGALGRKAYPEMYYAIERGVAEIGGDPKLRASIPFVVEAWAQKVGREDHISVGVTINRTPSTGSLSAHRNAKKEITLHGSGLRDSYPGTPMKGAFDIRVNVTTPFCPITSDGKAPDLDVFGDAICTGVISATKKAARAAPDESKPTVKDVVFEHMVEVITIVSGNGADDFNARQLLYRLRPIVKEANGQTLTTKNFNKILTAYENEHGEIEGMYRDPRGSISHPHTGNVIPLSTRSVENYVRPFWEFNKIIFIEKEGFSDAARRRGWDKRHDCMVMSSKGFGTRAAKDFIDKPAEHDEPVDVYAVTDADAAGTLIYETLQKATAARGARKIRIVHLGLQPWEAVEMGLEVEEFDAERDDQQRPVTNHQQAVAQYVRNYDNENGTNWAEWLQTHRVELNVMTTPQLMAWLDRKMAEHGAVKLIPPHKVIADEFENKLAEVVRVAVVERILREAKAEQQISKALRKIERPTASAFVKGIKALFAGDAKRPWRDFLVDSIKALVKKV